MLSSVHPLVATAVLIAALVRKARIYRKYLYIESISVIRTLWHYTSKSADDLFRSVGSRARGDNLIRKVYCTELCDLGFGKRTCRAAGSMVKTKPAAARRVDVSHVLCRERDANL